MNMPPVTYIIMHTYTHTGLDPVTPTVDCRAPQFTRDNSYVNVNYSSTLEGSTLKFGCVEGFLPSDVFTATCHPNGSWVPDPTSHVCTTAASGKLMNDSSNFYEWRSSYSLVLTAKRRRRVTAIV